MYMEYSSNACANILYLQAAFISPWPSIEKQKIVSHLLRQLELSKLQAATDLLSPQLKDDSIVHWKPLCSAL